MVSAVDGGGEGRARGMVMSEDAAECRSLCWAEQHQKVCTAPERRLEYQQLASQAKISINGPPGKCQLQPYSRRNMF